MTPLVGRSAWLSRVNDEFKHFGAMSRSRTHGCGLAVQAGASWMIGTVMPCTNLLEIASLAKNRNADVMVREELRGDIWFITEMYDFSLGGTFAAQEISFSATPFSSSMTMDEPLPSFLAL